MFAILPTNRTLEIVASDENLAMLESVTKALGSDTRLEILRLLGTHSGTVMEIAEALDLPQSTATLHIKILESAGLIKTDLQPAKRGIQKVCARTFDKIVISLPGEKEGEEAGVRISMPVGAFVEANIAPTCGLVSETGIIGQFDDPSSFYEPERVNAQLIWFHHGYLEYRFPNRPPHGRRLAALEVSLELCSEAPLHNEIWPSDITLWVNGVETGTWTSPADFGGERGLLTPQWWDSSFSQYGQLKVWKITALGSYVDGIRVSPVTLEDLGIGAEGFISVRIGVKDSAEHIGGVNLFGRLFGNYPQDIILRQGYA